MAHFRVIWEIDVEAESPLEAAQEAFVSMQDPDTLATSFSVEGTDGRHEVDLQLAEGEATVLGPDGKTHVSTL